MSVLVCYTIVTLLCDRQQDAYHEDCYRICRVCNFLSQNDVFLHMCIHVCIPPTPPPHVHAADYQRLKQNKEKKLHDFSTQANYIDQVTAAWRS
jgi:hypothetical protein